MQCLYALSLLENGWSVLVEETQISIGDPRKKHPVRLGDHSHSLVMLTLGNKSKSLGWNISAIPTELTRQLVFSFNFQASMSARRKDSDTINYLNGFFFSCVCQTIYEIKAYSHKY